MENKIRLAGDDKSPVISTNSVPKFIIEGLIGEKITEIYKSVEVLNYGSEQEKLEAKGLDNVKATIAVAKLELEELIILLKDMQDATMTPRHRAVRKLAKETLEVITDRADQIKKARSPNNKDILDAVTSILKFLTEGTKAMSDSTGEFAHAVFFDKEGGSKDVVFS
jgi:hypothetical protein